MIEAILIAISLTIVNAGSSFVISRIAMKKSWKVFNKLVFGSMVVRYFFTAACVILIVKYVDIPKLAFALTFLIATFILIIVEILFIHNLAKSGKLNNKKF